MRKRFFFGSFLLLMCLVLLQGCSVFHAADASEVYENTELGFRMELPSTWEGQYSVEPNEADRSSSSVIVQTSWGGILCYIFRNTQEAWQEQQKQESPVDYTLLAENDEYAYLLIPASDVQYDVNDPEQTKVY